MNLQLRVTPQVLIAGGLNAKALLVNTMGNLNKTEK